LSGVAKGLTHVTEGLLEGELEPAELEKINEARQDLRMVKLRDDVFGVVRNVVEIWSADAGVGHVCSLLHLQRSFDFQRDDFRLSAISLNP
jgi:hypothetical protein